MTNKNKWVGLLHSFMVQDIQVKTLKTLVTHECVCVCVYALLVAVPFFVCVCFEEYVEAMKQMLTFFLCL